MKSITKLFISFILSGPRISVPNFMTIYPTVVETFRKKAKKINMVALEEKSGDYLSQ